MSCTHVYCFVVQHTFSAAGCPCHRATLRRRLHPNHKPVYAPSCAPAPSKSCACACVIQVVRVYARARGSAKDLVMVGIRRVGRYLRCIRALKKFKREETKEGESKLRKGWQQRLQSVHDRTRQHTRSRAVRIWRGMCIDMCIDMRMHMCIDICMDMHMHMCMDICIDVCRDGQVYRHVCAHVARHVHRHVYRHVFRHAYRHAYRHVCRHLCRHVCV